MNSPRRRRLAELERERTLFGASPALTSSSRGEADEGGTGASVRGRLLVTRDGRHVFVEEDRDRELLSDRETEKEKEKEKVAEKEKDAQNVGSFEASMASLAALIAKSPSSASHNSHSDNRTCVSCEAASQLRKLDQWRPASSTATSKKSAANKAQAQTSTDKTLLALIEQERARYLQLESTHTTLLANLAHLQQAHRADMSRLQAQHRHTLNTISLDSREKSDRVTRTVRSLVGILNRYTAPGSSDLVPGEFMIDSEHGDGSQVVELLVGRIESVLRASLDRVDMVEDAVAEVRASKKVVSEKLLQREQEMKKLALFAKEKDDELVTERDAKMKLEVRVLHLERHLGQRQGELAKMNELYQGKVEEAQELVKLKERFENTCRTLDELVRREKMYLEEIEAGSVKERKLTSDLESLTKQHDKKSKELESIQTTLTAELSAAKELEVRLRKDLNESLKVSLEKEQELQELERIIQGGQQENNALAEKIIKLDNTNNNLTVILKTTENDLAHYRQAESDLRNDLTNLVSKYEQTVSEFQSLQQELSETQQKLDQETASKLAMQQANTSRLEAVAEKLNLLQTSLDEHQSQLHELRENESLLRTQLREREEAILEQVHKIDTLEKRIVELEGDLAKEGVALETMRSKKKEELIAVQEKFVAAKAAMDAEVNTLRNQLNAKSAQAAGQSDELARIKIEISELTADRFRLESRLAELTAQDQTSSRQLATLAQLLKQKEQDLYVMGIKHEALVEQVRLLEEELHMFRQSSFKRDIDMQKLQNNAEEIKKLKEQAGVLAGRRASMEAVKRQSSLVNLAGQIASTGSNYNLTGTTPISAAPLSPLVERKSGDALAGSATRLQVEIPSVSPLLARVSGFGAVSKGSRTDLSRSNSQSLSPNLGRKEYVAASAASVTTPSPLSAYSPALVTVSSPSKPDSSIHGLEDYLSGLLSDSK
ncbi:hypothetical protein BCR33DRAFT_733714 [Rhizoclosmatium globosum]|uniref:Uncharacterized protein n=1 Tax=Rhizoclosmatium globosum TaxID=329046 RepID=A0A1Y2CYG8_9FUNG|nr:hypothetical protein BCR33DRAFT_733714 [Rhizoclosmatium globosum]|eukprot:ORY51385.1 hypothetical protein BCR33DRAFT_733714 [Rhizoclosmatium globosum]